MNTNHNNTNFNISNFGSASAIFLFTIAIYLQISWLAIAILFIILHTIIIKPKPTDEKSKGLFEFQKNFLLYGMYAAILTNPILHFTNNPTSKHPSSNIDLLYDMNNISTLLPNSSKRKNPTKIASSFVIDNIDISNPAIFIFNRGIVHASVSNNSLWLAHAHPTGRVTVQQYDSEMKPEIYQLKNTSIRHKIFEIDDSGILYSIEKTTDRYKLTNLKTHTIKEYLEKDLPSWVDHRTNKAYNLLLASSISDLGIKTNHLVYLSNGKIFDFHDDNMFDSGDSTFKTFKESKHQDEKETIITDIVKEITMTITSIESYNNKITIYGDVGKFTFDKDSDDGKILSNMNVMERNIATFKVVNGKPQSLQIIPAE